MIKGKGKLIKLAGRVFSPDYEKVCNSLPDNKEYLFVICDDNKNRNLPYISYFFSVVLGYISSQLPGNPTPTSLYKYFEDMFAPVHTVEIDHEKFQYKELKTEKASDVNNVIEKVVEYALRHWGIDVPRSEEFKDPLHREIYSQAYLNQEVEWSNFISSRKTINKDERRNQKNERL